MKTFFNYANYFYNKHPFISGVSVTFIPLYSFFIYSERFKLKEQEKNIKLSKEKLIKEGQKLEEIFSLLSHSDDLPYKVDNFYNIDLSGQNYIDSSNEFYEV